jgi:AAA15 family ATPase/GTPase
MLVRLFGRNFRSLKGAFELSMVAADYRGEEDRTRGVIEVPVAGAAEPLRLLRAVAIFGANASGKSTVLMAGKALNWLVADSSAHSKPNGRIPPYEPFLLDDASRKEPIRLGCDVVYRDSLIRYEIEYGEKAILSERLAIFDEKGETVLIDRQPSGNVTGDLISRSDANRLYVKEMQPNVAVLSKLAQHGPHKGAESVHPYYQAIKNAMRHEDYSDAVIASYIGRQEDKRFLDDSEYREWIMSHLIRPADVGVCDVEVKLKDIPDAIRKSFKELPHEGDLPESLVIVSFLHEGSSKRTIDFGYESSGTRKLYNLKGDWWTLANKSVTILADELTASLHPRLLDSLVRAVNENPNAHVRSQLIFATHDTGLLEPHDGLPPALRRDQVYFAKKDSQGASEIYSLTEFKDGARTVHNIRKRYLSGIYGAIPSAAEFSL